MKKIIVAALCSLFICSANFAQTVEKHASEGMKIGIAGYTFRKLPNEKAFKIMKQLGVKYISLKNFQLPYEATKAEMDALKAKMAQYGVEGYTLGPIYMKSEKEVDSAFEYVKRYGCPMFVGVPTYDLLPYVEKKVKEYDIKIAIHTHGPDNQPFPDAEDVVNRVKDMDARIGICIDLGHTVRYGKNAAKDLVKYKSRIFDVHIKDVTAPSKAGKTCSMGRGVMDIPSIVKALRKIGYDGMVTLEYEPNPTDNISAVSESIGYLRGVCDAR